VTPVSSIVEVVIGAVIGSFGAVFLKWGAVKLSRDWRSVAFNWRLAVGVGAYMVSSAFFVMGMAHGELSVLYPMVSLGYIFTLVWSKVFFQEELTGGKLAGVGLILIGSVCLGIGNH
jgi:multidrug transporter EmrE-like cation transporter